MGLFDGLKKKAKEAPDPEVVVEKTEREYVNLTEKNVKAEIPEDGHLYVRDVYIWEEAGTVKGLVGDDVIFEVTSRSKAYKTLEPFFRRKSKAIALDRRTGDYGDYYRMTVIFEA